ncbi:MAG: SCO family protein [Actinomycetes bacterium]
MGHGAVLRLAAACLVGLTATACTAGAPAVTPPSLANQTPGVGTVFDKPIPSTIVHLPLVDQAGHRVTLASMVGKTVVVADFLTLCQEVCPLTSANLAQVQAAVADAGLSNQVEILEVTVDPRRDTPDRLAAYQKLFGSPPHWSFVTGSPERIDRFWKALGVGYERTGEPSDQPRPRDWLTGEPLTYDVSHQDVVIIVAPDGHERWLVAGTPSVSSTRNLPPTLNGFLNDEGRSNLASTSTGSWTPRDVEQALSFVTGRPVG